jgi:methyl-accepting chemotaxis protein
MLESSLMPAAIPPTTTFVVSGNLVILFLAGALFLVAGALVAVIVYVFRGLAKEVERLANRIEGLADSLGNRIDTAAGSLGSRIDSVAGSLSNRIEGLSDSLGNRIDGVAGSLGSRIDSVAGSLGNRIDKLTDRMDKLTERIGKLADTLHAEIASVRQDVYLRLEQTRERAS